MWTWLLLATEPEVHSPAVESKFYPRREFLFMHAESRHTPRRTGECRVKIAVGSKLYSQDVEINLGKFFIKRAIVFERSLVSKIDLSNSDFNSLDIRLSEKFLSFYKEIIDAQCFLFYVSLLNYART